jgi:hypothetical protein
MSGKLNYIRIIFTGLFFIILSSNCFSQETSLDMLDSQYSDTITLSEEALDTARFFLTENDSKIQNTIKGTIYLPIDGKIYKLPYRITSTASVVFKGENRYFRLTGLPLIQEIELQSYITELFKNPREYLKDVIPASQWKNSSVYLRYFEPYDKESPNRVGNEETNSQDNVNEFDQFKSNSGEGYVVQNYENFPFPETVDIEVDLRKAPGVVNILGLDFNFEKLDKGFQRLLLEYDKSGNNIKKSNSEKK